MVESSRGEDSRSEGGRFLWGVATQPGDTGGAGTGQRAPGGARGYARGGVRARGRHLPGTGEGEGGEATADSVYQRGPGRWRLRGRERVTVPLGTYRGRHLHPPARHRAR